MWVRLPCWLNPLPLESLDSFLERLRRYNSYREKNWLQTLPHPLGQHHPNLLRALKDYQFLAELTGVGVETLYNLTLHRFVPAFYLFEAWPSWPQEYDDLPAPLWEPGGLERYVHGQEHRKVCPLCWREQSTLLLPWSLHHITTCPIHQVFLVDLCSACGNQLAIDLSSGTCAHCKYELGRLPVSALDEIEEHKELTELLWSAIGCSDISFPSAYPALPAQHPLHQMQPAALLQFLWHGGQVVLNRDPENPLFSWREAPQGEVEPASGGQLLKQARVQRVHTVLLAMWRLLKEWPQSWYRLLERLVRQEEPLEATPATCLPALLKNLFPGDAFTWVHHGWEDFMWQSHSNFVQLAAWQRYWEATPRETRIKRPTAKPQRCHTNYVPSIRKAEALSEQSFVRDSCKL